MYSTVAKRILDITFSVVMLVALSWLFVLIILTYILAGYRNIFFIQERIGWKERSFRLAKFRTLKEDQSLSPQQRRFPLGNFLRLTSLDELPQLWNVLKGEMSFIGPRPLPVEYQPLFSEGERARHQIRPGITGWAQVNGRHSIPWREKFQLDLYYLRNISFALDMRILFRTIGLLLSFKKDTSLEEKKFTGNA